MLKTIIDFYKSEVRLMRSAANFSFLQSVFLDVLTLVLNLPYRIAEKLRILNATPSNFASTCLVFDPIFR